MAGDDSIRAVAAIVDTAEECEVLEGIIDSFKPAVPSSVYRLHHLIYAPFRCSSIPSTGSRFRGVGHAGVFYGADSVGTAAAELSYWRYKSFSASGIVRTTPISYTAFSVKIDTTAVDLRIAPFDVDAVSWEHQTDYTDTQQFAQAARNADIGCIYYRSVRSLTDSMCAAVLNPMSFAESSPSKIQPWSLTITPLQAIWARNGKVQFSLPVT
jgi:hypothetical protein